MTKGEACTAMESYKTKLPVRLLKCTVLLKKSMHPYT